MPQARTGQRNGHTRQRPASKQAKTTSRAKPRRSGGASKPESAVKATGSAPAKAAKQPAAKPAAAKTGKRLAKAAPKPKPATPRHLALKLAGKAAKAAAKKLAGGAAEHAADGLRSLTERAAEGTGEAIAQTRVKLTRRRLPIQRSVDIAVPLRLAWEEWAALEFLPEGAHTVSEIERDGGELTGRTSGPRQRDWSAEILDERPEQSFAWQSQEGSDCAGLITFHRLSERLTRVELNLDVVPSSPAEAAALATRLADRRTETELRRWKARLELISPDLYETEDEAEDEEPETEDGAAEESAPDRDLEEQD